ncbi:MAG TPA: AAA family ATPase [Candidatus Limnocylindrales bacterium]|nr:AAA family ATPase [Candidatus Limnocylindrales bacterium]
MVGRLVSPTLVGRADELAALEVALDQAVAGSPVHQLVAGEAGVGKSRLVRETSSLAAARGFRVLTGGCADLGEGGVPYGPIVEALRTLVRGLEPTAVDSIMGDARPDLARLVPSLGAAREAGTPTEFVAPRLLDGVLGVLQRLAEARPVLFIVEDLHWADAATREAIAFLARRLEADRVLLLMTFRADELHRRHPLLPWIAELERSGRIDRISLARLDEPQTAELLAAILGEPPKAGLVERVHRRSDGNPFFVEELVGAGAKAAAGPIPPTLREVLLARLVALPDPAQRVVQVAAVAGRRVDHDLLAEVANMDEETLIESLRGAVGGHVLVTSAGGTGAGDGDYAFRHALLQEAAYDDLLPGERQRLHRAFAEALAARGPGTGAPAAGHWAELAWHWSAARDLRRSFEASVRATEAAIAAYAFADAQRHGERALEQWPAVEDAAGVAGMDRATLLDVVAQAAWLASDSRRSVALRRDAISELEHGDPIRLGIAQERLGRALWYHGETAEALAAHETAIGLIPDEPPTPELARVLAGYGQILMLTDHWTEATEVLSRAVDLARRTGARQAEGHARNSLGLCLAVGGLSGEGYAALEQSLKIAHEIGSPDDIGRAYVNLASAHRYAGDPAGGLEVVRRGVVAATTFGLDQTYAYFIRSKGVQCAYELDAWDEATALADASIGSPASGRVHRRYGLANAVPLLVAQGDERAEARLDEFRTILAATAVESQFHAPLRMAEIEHGLWRGEIDEALTAYRTGVDELGATGWLWHDLRLRRLGLQAAADAAAIARARRDATGETRAREIGEDAWATLDRLATEAASAQKGLALDETEAERALAAAERTRLDGPGDVAAWAEARERWAARGNVYLAAYAGYRLAEAALSAGDRAAATDALRAAHAIATHLGARPLGREINALATRARIDLDATAAPEPQEAAPRDPFGLTPRERDVLPLLVQGRTNRQIAEALFISENTAGVHVSNILGKLGAATRAEAAGIAARLGIA